MFIMFSHRCVLFDDDNDDNDDDDFDDDDDDNGDGDGDGEDEDEDEDDDADDDDDDDDGDDDDHDHDHGHDHDDGRDHDHDHDHGDGDDDDNDDDHDHDHDHDISKSSLDFLQVASASDFFQVAVSGFAMVRSSTGPATTTVASATGSWQGSPTSATTSSVSAFRRAARFYGLAGVDASAISVDLSSSGASSVTLAYTISASSAESAQAIILKFRVL